MWGKDDCVIEMDERSSSEADRSGTVSGPLPRRFSSSEVALAFVLGMCGERVGV